MTKKETPDYIIEAHGMFLRRPDLCELALVAQSLAEFAETTGVTPDIIGIASYGTSLFTVGDAIDILDRFIIHELMPDEDIETLEDQGYLDARCNMFFRRDIRGEFDIDIL